MILSSVHLPESRLQAVDVCIIGAGAAGITLACELDRSPLKVMLLEAGGVRADADAMDYYRGTATPPHPDPVQFRRAVFGGTTSLWGGRCVALDPIDFEQRDYVADSGWPIRYGDFAQHYAAATSYCDAGVADFTTGCLEEVLPTIEGFDGGGTVLTDRIERYSLPTNFGARYRSRIHSSKNVTAILQARCLGLRKRVGDDSIEEVEFIDRANNHRRVRARVFVLATGGIEVPRILMNSQPEGAGLGNLYDKLGRYYCCHFENNCGRLVPNGAGVAFYFERTTDGVYCRRQLRFHEDAQRRHRLLNTAFRLHFPNYSDASHGSSVMSAIYLAKSMLLEEYRSILQHGGESAPAGGNWAHLRNVLGGLPQLAKFGGDWIFRIKLARRKLPYTLVANADGSFPLEFNCEQTPLPTNRVTLTNDIDRDGLRRVHVSWHLPEGDIDAAHRALLLLRDTLRARSVARFEFDEEVLRAHLGRSPPLGGHHIGTARMAHTPREGVVDTNCAVFGLPNLFIASSAVFPTSGHANPTLSIVALAVRLAATIKSELGELASQVQIA